MIVNADDYGKTPAANQAIKRTAAEGIVTSTTVMANMPDANQISDLKSACPWMSIGLHVNLTFGRPILPCESVGSLVDKTGNFWSPGEFLRRAWVGRIDREHVRAEIKAQLSRLRDLVGDVSHLDSHKHIHSRSLLVLDEVLKVGSSYGVRRLRYNGRHFVSGEKKHRSRLRLKLLSFRNSPMAIPGLGLTLIQKTKIRRCGYVSPDYILTPLPGISTESLDAAVEGWCQVFRHTPEGTFETIFHPGGGPYYDGQEALLCHPKMRETVRDLNIQLIMYSHLEPPGRTEVPSKG